MNGLPAKHSPHQRRRQKTRVRSGSSATRMRPGHGLPSLPTSESVMGLKVRSPAKTIAVTSCGVARTAQTPVSVIRAGHSAGEGPGTDLGRADKGVRRRVRVVAAGKVAVVARDDRVLLAGLDVLTLPLADTRAARVGCVSTTATNTNLVTRFEERAGQGEGSGRGNSGVPSTVAPASCRTPIWPSRAMVARICSEPGVTTNVDLALMPGTAYVVPTAHP